MFEDIISSPNTSPSANPDSYLRMNDIRLRDISIVSPNGTDMSIMNQYAIFQISEDMFQNNISGVVSNIDASNIVANFPLTGEEFLMITFATPGSGKEIELAFLIDKIIDRAPLRNNQSQFYDIHFVCPTFACNLFSSVSKSYTSSISNIVNDIFKNHLNAGGNQTRKELITNEKTFGETNIIIPSWNALTAINWLSRRAVSDANTKVCDYLFYQDLDGFHFRSVSSMFEGEPMQTYIYGVDNSKDFIRETPNSEIDMEKSFQNIRKISAGGFDRSKEVMKGTFSSNILIHDMITKSYDTVEYNYMEDFDKKPSLNGSPIMPKNNMYTDKTNSRDHFVPSHLNLYGEPSGSEENSGNDDVQNWLLRHDAQLCLLESNHIEIEVAGDTSRRVGDKVFALVNSFEGLDQQGRVKNDNMITGNYVVTKIKHTIHKSRGHMMQMKLCKESNMNPTPQNLTMDSNVLPSGTGNILS